jgi:hypothetical protein
LPSNSPHDHMMTLRVAHRTESADRAALATELPQYLRAEMADMRRTLEAVNLH